WDGHTLLTRCYSQQGSNAAIAFISENRSSLYMAGKRGAILDAAVTAYDAPFVDYLIKGEKLLAAYGDGRKANLVCYAIGTLVRNIYQRDIAGHENLEQKELVLKQLKENG